MYAQKWHWLDYDPVAVAVLVIGLGMIELLIWLPEEFIAAFNVGAGQPRSWIGREAPI